MKKFIVLFVVLTSMCAGQQPFDWPFQAGDRLLFGHQLIQFQETAFDAFLPPSMPYDTAFTDIFLMNYSSDDLPFLWSTRESIWPWEQITSVGISTDGILTYRVEYESVDFLPSRPPIEDTLWLYKHGNSAEVFRYCTNTRMFDTTMYAKTVQAFATDVYRENGTFIYRATFADGFWLVQLEWPNQEPIALTGFIIGVQEYNFPEYEMEYPVYCPDLYYKYTGRGQYSMQEWWPIDYRYSLRDTVINGVTYYLENGSDDGPVGVLTPPFPVRSVGYETRIWNGTTEETLPPLLHQLGDSVVGSWLVNIDTVAFKGTRLRFTMQNSFPIIDAATVTQIYYSGIGLYSYNNMLDIMLPYAQYSLEDYTPCVVSVESPLPSLPRWQAVVYPSPAKSYITLSIQHAATAAPLSGTLMITDELGRTVLSQQWNEVTEHSALTLPVAGFAPGVYYYRLVGNNAWLAGQFVVER